MYADLHIHTCFSDGTQTPKEIVDIAKKKGLDAISICDHNTIDAYDELIPLCANENIQLVRGVELSVNWSNQVLHILAYNFNPFDTSMLELINETRAELDNWSMDLIVSLKRKGFPVTLNEYEKFKKNPKSGGWKCLYYLNQKKILPNMRNWREFYEKYGHCPVYHQIDEACKIIKDAGGTPVLAHPGRRPGFELINTDTLTEFKSFGLMGIECYYPSHSPELTNFCVNFCRKNDMRITSGGDSHGSFLDKVYPNEKGVVYDIGIMKTPLEEQYLNGIINGRNS